MENKIINYNIEIDDYPISFSPFQSVDFNFKIIAKLLYFHLKNNKNCTIKQITPYIVEIKLFNSFIQNKIFSRYFVNSLRQHVIEKSFYSRYLSFIDIRSTEVIADNVFRVKLKIPISYINDILESHFFVPINDKGIPIQRRDLDKTSTGFKIFDSKKSFNFIVNKDTAITSKLFENKVLDLNAFSLPNYNLLEYDRNQFKRYEFMSTEGSLLYYIKFNGEHDFLEHFTSIRYYLQNLLTTDRFLIPTVSFLGTPVIRNMQKNIFFKKNKVINNKFKKELKIGYSDYTPNKKIAKAIQQTLFEMFDISSVLVEFENLSSLISNFNDVDIVLGITYPSFNNYISIGLDVVPDLEQNAREKFIEKLNLNQFDNIDELFTYSKSMLPIFKSRYFYVKKEDVSFQINTYGEIIDDELK
ncbi:TPA: hypothetical protein U1047_001630 [Streptococcus suis]|nr:hypothetical protein [Streptococcus suis]HEM4716012.1 hypothetical protein [Streptococcus suis]HEM4720697.1 hypothetical protein [Streptococcus suis]HEM4727449.1 hypothetical protein [Streptococcus suis]HEM4735230.1 hypothetical protein [Streptococcus suis]